MKAVQVRTAVIAGAVAVVTLGIVFQLIVNRGSALPRHSWWEAGALLVAGGALASAGWRIRVYVRSLTTREPPQADRDGDVAMRVPHAVPAVEAPSPENARRTLVLAQAAAVGGAVLAGWYAAQIGVQLSRWSVPSVRTAVLLLGVLTIEAVALSVLGFRVQSWCTLPDDRR